MLHRKSILYEIFTLDNTFASTEISEKLPQMHWNQPSLPWQIETNFRIQILIQLR